MLATSSNDTQNCDAFGLILKQIDEAEISKFMVIERRASLQEEKVNLLKVTQKVIDAAVANRDEGQRNHNLSLFSEWGVLTPEDGKLYQQGGDGVTTEISELNCVLYRCGLRMGSTTNCFIEPC